jgi:hypothetical protein
LLPKEDFIHKVAEVWNQVVHSDDPIDVPNFKIKRFKKYFKGWGSNVFGQNWKIKKR